MLSARMSTPSLSFPPRIPRNDWSVCRPVILCFAPSVASSGKSKNDIGPQSGPLNRNGAIGLVVQSAQSCLLTIADLESWLRPPYSCVCHRGDNDSRFTGSDQNDRCFFFAGSIASFKRFREFASNKNKRRAFKIQLQWPIEQDFACRKTGKVNGQRAHCWRGQRLTVGRKIKRLF